MSLISFDFQVFGKVQSKSICVTLEVYFRLRTQEKATELGVVGWVQNTLKGTVIGVVQGTEDKAKEMSDWLRLTGSPGCKIDKFVMSNKRQVQQLEY